jgi:hypothetical protein
MEDHTGAIIPVHAMQERLLQLETIVQRLEQIEKSRSGNASVYEERDRSFSVSLDISTTALASEETKVSPSSSVLNPSLHRLDDGVGERVAMAASSQSVQIDVGHDSAALPRRELVASLSKVRSNSNFLKDAHRFGTGQDEPDASIVHRSILVELYKIPQFKAMPSNDIEAAVQASVRCEGSSQQILMRKGDTDTSMIFIVIGSLCVKINDDSQPSVISSGSLVGSHAFLYKRPRSATVSCVGHCVYYRIDLSEPSVGSAAMIERNFPQHDSAAGLPLGTVHGVTHSGDVVQDLSSGTEPIMIEPSTGSATTTERNFPQQDSAAPAVHGTPDSGDDKRVAGSGTELIHPSEDALLSSSSPGQNRDE